MNAVICRPRTNSTNNPKHFALLKFDTQVKQKQKIV